MFLNYNKDKKCSVCGIVDLYMFTLRDFYAIHENSCLCEKCGDHANTFITGYTSPKPNDVGGLHNFLNNGIDAQRKYQQQMNGGYYV